MMYESPVNLYEINNIISEITKKVENDTETYVMEGIRRVGVDVDKDELIKALRYDRDQYNKGYADGKEWYEFVLNWLVAVFDAPCGYSFNNQDVANFIGEKDPEFCSKNCDRDFKKCWEKYFDLLREEMK